MQNSIENQKCSLNVASISQLKRNLDSRLSRLGIIYYRLRQQVAVLNGYLFLIKRANCYGLKFYFLDFAGKSANCNNVPYFKRRFEQNQQAGNVIFNNIAKAEAESER